MTSNVRLDTSLVQEVMRLGAFRTKREAVTEALVEFVARRRQRQILELAGKIDFDSEYDYRQQRKAGG